MTAAPILWHESVASTQDEAHRLAAGGAAHGFAVAAKVQTGGRGTRGRTWESGNGGLWLSVVCRPGPGAATEVIGLRVGLAVAGLLDGFLLAPHRVALCDLSASNAATRRRSARNAQDSVSSSVSSSISTASNRTRTAGCPT